MRLRPEQLAPTLAKKPQWRALLISGDEPYLTIELGDMAREHYRLRGYDERDLFEVDGRFDWDQFIASTLTLSLFSSEKIIELRFDKVPDRAAQKAIQTYCENPQPDLFLIITTPRLNNSALRAKWVQSIESIGAIIPVYPPTIQEYPRWIEERARRKGLHLSQDAIVLLAQNNEGNLFSLMQELDYLLLFFGNELIGVDALEGALVQSSKFIIFDLSDALLVGNSDRIYRIITSLRAEGEPATLVNWMLHKEISTLRDMLQEIDQGANMQHVLSSIWQRKRPLYQHALSRLNLPLLNNLSIMVVQIDQAIKGEIKEEPWNAILRVTFALAGRRVLSLSAKV